MVPQPARHGGGLGAAGAIAVPADIWAAALIIGAAAGALVGNVLAGRRGRGRGEPSAAVIATLPPDGQVPLSLSTPPAV